MTGANLPDLILTERGFLVGGDNLVVYSTKASKSFHVKTTQYKKIKLNLSRDSYYVSLDGDENMNFTAGINGNDFTFYVYLDFPVTDDNTNLGVEVSVINDSGKNVRIKLMDKTGKAKIVNRSGVQIYARDDSERVSLI